MFTVHASFYRLDLIFINNIHQQNNIIIWYGVFRRNILSVGILAHFQFYSGLKAGDAHFYLLRNTIHNIILHEHLRPTHNYAQIIIYNINYNLVLAALGTIINSLRILSV